MSEIPPEVRISLCVDFRYMRAPATYVLNNDRAVSEVLRIGMCYRCTAGVSHNIYNLKVGAKCTPHRGALLWVWEVAIWHEAMVTTSTREWLSADIRRICFG